MRYVARLVSTILISLLSVQASAIEPIKVLVAKTGNVSNAQALSMLTQINLLTQNSSLSSRIFTIANTLGVPEVAPCAGSNYVTLLECAAEELETTRNQHNADIVLMLVPTLGASICGGTPPGLVNTFFTVSSQRQFGYAVVSNQCMLTNGLYPASHEVLHLLYAEHKSNDPHTDRPAGARNNHAATQVNFATAGAVPSDCNPNYTCSNFQNFMSEDDKNFSNGFPAGNSLHSNVKNFVQDTSWEIVAAYLPIPPPEACEIVVHQVCENNSPRAIVTPTLAGYTMTNVDLDYRLSGSSTWYPIYDGAPTCPIYDPPSTFMNSIVNALVTTAAGYVTGCTVQVTPIWCGNGDPL